MLRLQASFHIEILMIPFLEFSVNKSNVLFSVIGADHSLDQENRAVKILGGIKGIANSQNY